MTLLIKNKILNEFILSSIKNSYIKHKGYSIYLRKRQRIINECIGFRFYLDVGNIERIDGKGTSFLIPEDERNYKKGRLKETVKDLEEAAKRLKYKGVFFECVNNDFLPEVLKRYDYIDVSNYNEKSFVKFI